MVFASESAFSGDFGGRLMPGGPPTFAKKTQVTGNVRIGALRHGLFVCEHRDDPYFGPMDVNAQQKPLDVLVIGGGINGVGIARDAVGRGYSVLLCERDDFAAHTSSASTKLVHGGLRYLEQYEFKLVRESLTERERLLRAAPHIIWPMRFILPHHKGLRPAWLLRLGLFVYDHLGGRKMLPPTKRRRFAEARGPANDESQPVTGAFLDKAFTFGFEYSDCWVEDSRLVVLNALDAEGRGAQMRSRTACKALERQDGLWRVLLEDSDGNKQWVLARSVVNAAGPWVDDILRRQGGSTPNAAARNASNLRLVKGSHIVTKRLYDGDEAFIFQHTDGRIAFAIPYENDFTLIGTTDLAFNGDAASVEIDQEEISYLCDLVNTYLHKSISADDVVWSYSGVRPLFDDQQDNASVVTRDYVFDMSSEELGAPLLSIFGGKITTYRKMAEHAVDRLIDRLPLTGAGRAPSAPWTEEKTLPGGDIPDADFDGFFTAQKKRYPGFEPRLIRRLARAYGTRMGLILGDHQNEAHLGEAFGAGLTQAECAYLVTHEFAATAEDILWRRSKLGLHMTADEIKSFSSWFEQAYPSRIKSPSLSTTKFGT
ncbi:MAG: glycerol-3-phosphate dehydrogenase [Pseudomonadota bacterium]